MKGQRQDLLLGTAAILFFFLFAATFLFLYPKLHGGGGRNVAIHFPTQNGMAPLKIGSPVFLAGSVQVGSVRAIRIESVEAGDPKRPSVDPKQHADAGVETDFVVETTINDNVPLYGNCQISTDQPAVGGGGYIVILNVGTPDVPFKEPIVGRAPQGFAAVLSGLSGTLQRVDQMLNPEREGSLAAKITRSMADVNAMTGELRTQLNPREEQTLLWKLGFILDNLNALTTALRQQTSPADSASLVAKLHIALDHLGTALAETSQMLQENRPVVHATLQAAEHAVESIDADLLAKARAELNREDPNSLLGKVHIAMDHLNTSLADVRQIADDGRQLVALNRPTIERTLANVKDMSDQLRLASQEIRLAPWRLLYRPTPSEQDKLGIFESARLFAEAATYLDDAAARLEAALAVEPGGAPAGAADEIRAIQESLRSAFERFQRAENYLFDKLK